MIAGINEILTESAALISEIGSGKIYPLVVPAGIQPPFLATSMAGVNVDDIKTEVSGLDYNLVNVTVHAQDYDQLDEVSEAVRDALDNITAQTTAGPYNFVTIKFKNAVDRPDLYTTDRPLYARTVQFKAIVKR